MSFTNPKKQAQFIIRTTNQMKTTFLSFPKTKLSNMLFTINEMSGAC